MDKGGGECEGEMGNSLPHPGPSVHQALGMFCILLLSSSGLSL